MKHIVLLLVSIMLPVAAAVSCGGNTTPTAKPSSGLFITPIAEIVDNPQKFADGIVAVKGEVSKSFGLFKKSFFTLTDRTGSVKVYCPSSMAPSNGEIVKVEGQVHLVYRFNDRSMCYIKKLEK